MAITWTKLKSGAYGIRSTEPIEAGVPVTVEKKSGETSVVVVERILWTGADRATGHQLWLATIQRDGQDWRESKEALARPARTHDNELEELPGARYGDDDIPF